MDDASLTSFGSPASPESKAPFHLEDLSDHPTPGQILGQVGRVIAVCLGLGVLAHVLVALIGG